MRKLISLIQVVHPITSLSVSIIAVFLSLPLDNNYILAKALLFGFTVLLIQFVIGASNDLLDQQLDVKTKPWKPLPSHKVNPNEVKAILLLLMFLILLFSSSFNIQIQMILLGGLGLGLIYNLGLKRTLLSWLPLSLALPLLFTVSKLVSDNFLLIYLWSFPISLFLGPAIHIANQIPDSHIFDGNEKSLTYYCRTPKNASRIASGLLIIASISIVPLTIIYESNQSFIIFPSLMGVILSVLFLSFGELDRINFLFPITIIITTVLALGFILIFN